MGDEHHGGLILTRLAVHSLQGRLAAHDEGVALIGGDHLVGCVDPVQEVLRAGELHRHRCADGELLVQVGILHRAAVDRELGSRDIQPELAAADGLIDRDHGAVSGGLDLAGQVSAVRRAGVLVDEPAHELVAADGGRRDRGALRVGDVAAAAGHIGHGAVAAGGAGRHHDGELADLHAVATLTVGSRHRREARSAILLLDDAAELAAGDVDILGGHVADQNSVRILGAQHRAAGNVQAHQVGLALVVTDLTDSGGILTLHHSVAGNVDLNLTGVADVGVDHDGRAVIADTVGLGILIADDIVVGNAADRTAGDVQRTGLDADAAVALHQAAGDIDLAGLGQIDCQALGLDNCTLKHVDVGHASVSAVALDGGRLGALHRAVNIQLGSVGLAAVILALDEHRRRITLRTVRNDGGILVDSHAAVVVHAKQRAVDRLAGDVHIRQCQLAVGIVRLAVGNINGTVLDGHFAVGDKATGHGHLVQVDGDIRVDLDAALGDIRQQSHGLAVLSRRNGLGQCLVRLDGIAVLVQNLGGHAVNSREGAVLVPGDTSAGSREAGSLAVHLLLGGDVGVEVDERTAADGDIRTAVHIRLIDAVDQILAAAFPLLVQVEGAALDRQGALLHLNHADVAVEGAVFDGQVALHHVDGVAVVLLGIYGAVAGDGHLGAICDGQDSVGLIAPDVHRVTDGLAVQIQRDALVDGQLGVLLHIRQQGDGLALCSQTDRIGQGLILGAADLGNILAFLDAVGAIRILGGDEAVSAIAIGNTLVKRTAGDLEVVRGGLADTAENALPRFLVDEVAAGNPRDSGMALHNTGRDDLRVVPLSCGGQVLDKLAAADGGITVRKDNSCVSVRRIIQRERTAADIQHRVFLALDHVQTAGVGTAGDGQGAVVVDHGGAIVARRGVDIRQRQVGIAALRDLDVVVVVAAHNITVLHGNGAALHRDRGLAGVGVGQGLAAQIKGDALADDHVLSDIRQQSHGLAVLRRRNGLGQGLVALAADLGNILAFLHAVGAVRVLGGDVAVSAQGLVHLAGERTAGDGNLVVLREIARGQVLPVVGLDRGVGAVGRERAALDLDLVQALVADAVHDGDGRAVLDGAVVNGLGNAVTSDGDGRASAADVQAAGADLHAHGLGVDDAVVDGQRAGAGEVDAEAVGHVQRAVPQRHGIVGVVAVGLDAAAGGGRHLDAIELQTGIVIPDGAAHGGGDQTHQLAADHLAVLHGQRCIGVVDLEGRAVCICAGAGPGMAVQIHRAVNAAGAEC